MVPVRDREFAEFVEREGDTLLWCAYLCHGKPAAARDAVELALARVYVGWGRAAPPRLEALRFVSQPEAARPFLPWRWRGRADLVDVAPSRPAPPPMLVRELGKLPDEQRRALVLALVGGLTTKQISFLLGAAEPEVQQLLSLAEARLESRRAVFGSTENLTEALQQAVPVSLREGRPAPETDRAHGRFLIRARRRRVLALSAAAVAAVVLVVQGLGIFRSQAELSNERPVPVASIAPRVLPTFPPVPTPGEPSCETNYPPCRYQIIQQWRAEMREVAAEYVDPDASYFSYDYFDGDDSDSVQWDEDGGALEVTISGGGTQLFIQMATSREFAVQCGAQTDQDCRRQRFLNGNWLNLTQSSTASEGIEVQFVPYDEVITIVAKDIGTGKTLPIDRGQLVELIEDPRLRLPAI